jgi:hypothetical protein
MVHFHDDVLLLLPLLTILHSFLLQDEVLDKQVAATFKYESAHSHALRTSSHNHHVHDDHDDHSHNHRGLVGYSGEPNNSNKCGTPDPTTEQRARMRAATIEWKAKQGPPGARQAKSYTIKTWIHVLAKDATTGQMTQEEIDFMITSLNKYYTGSGLSFELAGSETIENESWYNCGYDNELEFKAASRQGERDTLNIWVRQGRRKSESGKKTFPYSHFVFLSFVISFVTGRPHLALPIFPVDHLNMTVLVSR